MSHPQLGDLARSIGLILAENSTAVIKLGVLGELGGEKSFSSLEELF